MGSVVIDSSSQDRTWLQGRSIDVEIVDGGRFRCKGASDITRVGGGNSAISGLDFIDLDSVRGFLGISVLRDILIMEIGDID